MSNEIIARQAKEIYELTDQNEKQFEALVKVKSLMTRCGGPLNDNFYGYNKEQRKIFFDMKNIIEAV